MPELRYAVGAGDGIVVADGSAFVVMRGLVDVDHVDRILTALREGRPLAELLDVVTRGRLGDLPDFVVAVPEPVSGGLRIIQRPGLDVTTTDSDGSVHVHSAAGSAVWSEHTTPPGSSIVIDLAGGGFDSGSFPLGSGAAATSFVRWSPTNVASSQPSSPSSRQEAIASDLSLIHI